MTDENYFTYPEGPGGSFSAEDWKRAKRAEKKLAEKLAASCRQLVRNGEKLVDDEDIDITAPVPPVKRMSREEEREAAAQRIKDAEQLAGWSPDE